MRVKFLQDQIEDFDYYAQELLVRTGMSPDDFDEANYYRLAEIMQARSRDKRPEDPLEMLKRLGLAPDNEL